MKRYIRSAVRLFKDEPKLVKYQATLDPVTTPGILDELYNDPDIDAEHKMEILCHPNLRAETQEAMIADNPGLETNIHIDFWSEDRDFPVKEFEARLVDMISNSRFGNNLKSFECIAENKPIQMNTGVIAYYFDLRLIFRPILGFATAKDEIYNMLDALVESMGAHPHMHSFDYNYDGNHWR